jgi:flavin-dependent dehydrogenase
MISGLKAAETIESLWQAKDFSGEGLNAYDQSVYRRLWPELNLSYKMQRMVRYPWLFNLIVNKANRSKTLQDTISCMFDDLELRERLRDPKFYLKVLME